MTPARICWSCLLLALLMLSGCSLPRVSKPLAEEANLFRQGLHQYIASGDLTSLKQLPQQYPQGAWSNEAELFIKMALQQAQQKKQEQALREKEKQPLASCRQKQAALVQDNKKLKATLNQLKEVLIDTELKAK